MDVSEAAAILSKMYRGARKGEMAVQVHLFGVKYAKQLQGMSLSDVVSQVGLPSTYATEVNKGRNLAKYVRVID